MNTPIAEEKALTYEQVEAVVLQAIRYIAAKCNGAVNTDEIGFNGRDTGFGKSLAMQIHLTPNQLLAGRKMLRTYQHTQIAHIELPPLDVVERLCVERKANPIVYVPQKATATSETKLVAQKVSEGLVEPEGRKFIRVSWPKGTPNFGKKLEIMRAAKTKFKGSPGFNGQAWVLTLDALDFVVEKLPELELDEDFAEIQAARLAETQRLLKEAEEAEQRRFTEIAGMLAALGDLSQPLPDGTTLYKHQQECVKLMVSHKYHGFINALDVGLGKTKTALVAMMAYQKYHGSRIVVLCPPNVREVWLREARALGVSIECYSWGKIPEVPMFPYVLVADECFPYDTPVVTDQGMLPIGYIVENNLPVYVASCNFDKDVVEYKQVARYIKKSLQGNLVKVTHEHGSFVCTPNHKIWTEETGYVEAGTLTSGTHLRKMPNALYDAHKGQDDSTVLQQELRGTSQQCTAPCSGGTPQKDGEDSSNQSVRILQSGVPIHSNEPVAIEDTQVLQPLMLQLMEEPTSSTERVGQASHQVGTRGTSRSQESSSFPAHDAKQSHEGSARQREDAKQPIRENLPCEGRQWAADETAGSSGGSIAITYGVPYSHGVSERAIPFTSPIVQSGPCIATAQSSNRGGWQVTSDTEMEISGSTQNGSFELSRVVGVEVYERGSFDRPGQRSDSDHYVYNLEIVDNHNYIADGILVSNCHLAQNMAAQRTKRFLELALHENCMAAFPTSGTPCRNGRPINIMPLLIAIKHQVAADRKAYEKRYCNAKKTRHSEWDTSGSSFLDELNLMIADSIMYRKKRDCLDMPEIANILEPVELSSSARKLYSETLSHLDRKHEEAVAATKERYIEGYLEHVEMVIDETIKAVKKNKVAEFKEDKMATLGPRVYQDYNEDIVQAALGVMRKMPDRALIAQKAFSAEYEGFAGLKALTDSHKADFEAYARLGDSLVLLGQVRHAGELAKVEATVDLAEEILEEGNQIVIFAIHQDAQEMIAATLAERLGVENKFVLFNAKLTNKAVKDAVIDRFQSDDPEKSIYDKVFIGSYGSAGVGITLTKAHYMILVAREWVPTDVHQAIGRIDRVSQKVPMTIYWMQYGEMDEYIDKILKDKQDNIDKILGTSAASSSVVDKEQAERLLQRMLPNYKKR